VPGPGSTFSDGGDSDEAREVPNEHAPATPSGTGKPHTRPSRATIHRRRFLGGLGAGVALGALGLGVDDLVTSSKPAVRIARDHVKRRRKPLPSVQDVELQSGVVVPSAMWVLEENDRAGTLDWLIDAPRGVAAIQGYADTVSAAQGQEIALYVDSPTPTFHVEAYRMGYYQGLGARLVWTSEELPGIRQAPASLSPGVNMISCAWQQSTSIPVTSSWPPGTYLLKLVGSNRTQGFVPLCVRDDSSTAAFVVQSSVTTWQAYNLFGDYSLYFGPGHDWHNRSRVVSFDRPYAYSWAWGAADFIGNEFPLIHLMERCGLDVTYSTDVDLHANPGYLLQHKALFSLGHDEYWSTTMRNAATNARDQGVNLCFLGANACYRRIRFEASDLGPLRHQVCYKNEFEHEDPLWGVDPSEVTANWPDGPDPEPQQSLVGSFYVDVGASADMVVADQSSWLLQGTGLSNGAHVPRVLEGEYDRYEPGLKGGPDNVDLVFHSSVTNRGHGAYSDMTYYSAPGGGGVVDTSSAAWVNALFTQSQVPANVVCPSGQVSPAAPTLTRIMENVFSVFGKGPAAETDPSTSNWEAILKGASSTTETTNAPLA